MTDEQEQAGPDVPSVVHKLVDELGRVRALGLLRLHEAGMRREACALDRMRFNSVVHRLRERYGWR